MPRLGGLAILAGLLVGALIFLPFDGETRGILGGALLVGVVGAIDDLCDLPPRGEAGRTDRRGRDPGRGGRAGRDVHAAVRRRRSTSARPAAAILTGLAMVAVMNVVNFTDGVDGLAAGVCTISAGDVRGDRAVARPRRRGRPGGGHRRRGARVPLAQLPPGERLHGRCRVEPARADARVHRGPGRAENGRRRRPRLPARRAGRADPRHGVRRRQAVQVPATRRGRPTPSTSITAWRGSGSRSGGRCSTCTCGRWRSPRSRWRCGSCRTRTTTATSTPAGRS